MRTILKTCILTLVLALALPTTIWAASDPPYIQGKVVKVDNDTASNIVYVVIDSGDTLYYGEWVVPLQFFSRPRLTENGTVEYSIKKDTLRLIDERGKSFSFKISKRRIKSE